MAGTNETDANRWRYVLAERIAASYARDSNARVVMIAGSVGRGRADRYSDIEVDVYYARPPSVEERVASVEGCGGVVELLDEDADEWEEQMLLGGFHAATSTFLVSTMERYLSEVVNRAEFTPLAQVRLHSLQHAVTVKGEEQVERWRARAAAYPDELVHTMLREHLTFRGFGYAEDMLTARDDLLLLYSDFVAVERQIIGALLGLNRLYLPTPAYMKGLDEMVEAMALKPDNLAGRLKNAFHNEPVAAVGDLKALIGEVFTLVDVHVPDFDTVPYRANLAKRRPVWDTPPGLVP